MNMLAVLPRAGTHGDVVSTPDVVLSDVVHSFAVHCSDRTDVHTGTLAAWRPINYYVTVKRDEMRLACASPWKCAGLPCPKSRWEYPRIWSVQQESCQDKSQPRLLLAACVRAGGTALSSRCERSFLSKGLLVRLKPDLQRVAGMSTNDFDHEYEYLFTGRRGTAGGRDWYLLFKKPTLLVRLAVLKRAQHARGGTQVEYPSAQ
jgi:hypothetical protein